MKSCGSTLLEGWARPPFLVPLTQADAGCCRADDDAVSHHVPRFPLSAPPWSRRAVTYHVAQLSKRTQTSPFAFRQENRPPIHHCGSAEPFRLFVYFFNRKT
ncbi:hypothetical protein CEXT_747831 [Caerostris extrusa]|uniref:Secreted protein n=1 Tax=Caerostris extrusa TaxID=172846 RepID=A0AAV4T3I7_CAEEX|nr:hypothetical protein CEXT_747831 [Caerostris extrusa]